MLRNRVIPCLLLRDRGLVKTVKFKHPKYIGDPINAVRIFNEKEVDELIFLDTTATVEQREPPFDLVRQIATECFMPFCYGGGIRQLNQMAQLFTLGVEKVALNAYAVENPSFVGEAAAAFGSQSVVVSIDAKKNLFGKYRVHTYGGRKATKLDPVKHAAEMERMGAGELLINSVDLDGTMQGYDLGLIRSVTEAVRLPVIACGGAGSISDLAAAVKKGGAAAASAGSMFVFQGKHRAVLINFPAPEQLRQAFS